MNNIEHIQTKLLSEDFQTRFWSKVSKTETCWIWIGSISDNRYGEICCGNGKKIKTHIASWIMHFGPLEEGQKVLHKCDITKCVHPDHLFTGTQMDNMHDAIKKGRHSFKTRFQGKISKQDAEEIRRLYFDCGVTQAALGRAFHLNSTTVWSIVHFETWL